MKQDEIIRLDNKEFRIESAQIRLTNRGDHDFVIIGSGLIEMLPTGRLQATLFTNDCDRKLLHKNFNAYGDNKIIEDGTYFDLELFGFSGDYWISRKVLINYWNSFSINGFCLKSKIDSIRKESRIEIKSSFFNFFISNKHKIPVNLYENFPGGGFPLKHRLIYICNIKTWLLP